MKALSLLLVASLLALPGCKDDAAATKAHEALIVASAAIKTPLRLDSYTTLVRVSVPERLLQEFVYEVTEPGIKVLEAKFPELAEKARRQSCSSFSHVVKYDGRERFVWQRYGRTLREVTITKADCAR